MLAAFFMSWGHFLSLGLSLLRSIGSAGWRVVPKRLLLFIPGWCLFGLLNLVHWTGFLLDELLFPGYRQVSIRRPVAIVGVPRSGTTHLYRVLAGAPGFTTLTLFECVLAPSISERYFWFAMARLLRPLARFRWPVPRGFLARMADIHELGLMEPEEDFLLLLWLGACFLLVVPCPAEPRYWRLGSFDEALPAPDRRTVFEFYRRCLQRHLYFHGEQLQILSKNPSFTPALHSLREVFPDAVLVACVREPGATVPSQLSSLLPAFALVGDGKMPAGFQQKMIETLRHYYSLVGELSREGLPVVTMARLQNDLAAVVDEVLAAAGLVPTVAFRASLKALGQSGRSYQSGHRYAAADFGLDEETINRFFSGVWPLS
ncbi:MAG: sulfotransferase [Pseudomonadota bacterium]